MAVKVPGCKYKKHVAEGRISRLLHNDDMLTLTNNATMSGCRQTTSLIIELRTIQEKAIVKH